jgi:hypothetical protein
LLWDVWIEGFQAKKKALGRAFGRATVDPA